MLVNQPSALPSRKVGAGLLAGALTTIVVWVVGLLGVVVPPEVSSSFTLLLGFGASYFVKERAV